MENNQTYLLSASFDGSNGASSSSDHTKKLKLFGVELQTSRTGEESDESVNSTVSQLSEEKASAEEEKKFGCEFCGKEFGNSQALGGHQNAHKKERQKRKRLQLQANKASISLYLNHQHHPNSNWFYDPSSCYDASEFTVDVVDATSQINFGFSDGLGQQSGTGFRLIFDDPALYLTREECSKKACKPPPPSLPNAKQSCKSNLDLRLGLGFDSNIRSSSTS